MSDEANAKVYRWDEILKRIKSIKQPIVAEVGVDNGKTSKRLLSMHKGLILFMIDRWAKPPAGDSYITSGASIPSKGQGYFKRTYNNCIEIEATFKPRAKIIRGESTVIVHDFPDKYFDCVFIDADHSFDGCYKDIINWLPKVKSGGFISGHDYDHPDQGEVKRAVAAALPGKKIEVGENRTWFYKVE